MARLKADARLIISEHLLLSGHKYLHHMVLARNNRANKICREQARITWQKPYLRRVKCLWCVSSLTLFSATNTPTGLISSKLCGHLHVLTLNLDPSTTSFCFWWCPSPLESLSPATFSSSPLHLGLRYLSSDADPQLIDTSIFFCRLFGGAWSLSFFATIQGGCTSLRWKQEYHPHFGGY